MRVWEIILPRRDNSGVALHQAHKHYAGYLADTFGGFTQYDTCGVWRDDEGKLYQDHGIAYRIAVDFSDQPALLAVAARLFPDQLAFYVQCGDQAAIVAAADAARELLPID